jgi:hypothetical protein
LKYFRNVREDPDGISFSVAVRFLVKMEPHHERSFETPAIDEEVRIAWTLLPIRKKPNGEQYWEAIDYFSMLLDGCIPDHSIDFFEHFILWLEHKWLELCEQGQKHLSEYVS